MQFTAKNLCIGIDPAIHFRHPFFQTEEQRVGFGKVAASVTKTFLDVLPRGSASFKFQSAYFEARGAEGFSALAECVRSVNSRGHFVILDAKRGDIGSSMEAYGRYAFDVVAADALTVMPWMGPETFSGISNDLAAGKFIYVVLLSSNGHKGSFQGDLCLSINEEKGFGHDFLSWLESHQHKRQMGLVVGVNRVDELTQSAWDRIRRFPLLMPGVGAQGATVGSRLGGEISAGISRHFISISRGVTGDFGKFDLSGGDDGVGVRDWASYSAFVHSRLRCFVSDL